jgi:hypothetical protein
MAQVSFAFQGLWQSPLNRLGSLASSRDRFQYRESESPPITGGCRLG